MDLAKTVEESEWIKGMTTEKPGKCLLEAKVYLLGYNGPLLSLVFWNNSHLLFLMNPQVSRASLLILAELISVSTDS